MSSRGGTPYHPASNHKVPADRLLGWIPQRSGMFNRVVSVGLAEIRTPAGRNGSQRARIANWCTDLSGLGVGLGAPGEGLPGAGPGLRHTPRVRILQRRGQERLRGVLVRHGA